jgi:integrase
MTLVQAHLERLAEDGRAPATQATYRVVAGKLRTKLGGVRVGEAAPARIDAALRSMSSTRGPVSPPSQDHPERRPQPRGDGERVEYEPGSRCAADQVEAAPKGAPALTAEQLRDLLAGLRASEYCREHDLVDPFTLFIATGLRRCELLALRWSDFDETAETLAITGKVVRITGQRLIRVDETKTTAGPASPSRPCGSDAHCPT